MITLLEYSSGLIPIDCNDWIRIGINDNDKELGTQIIKYDDGSVNINSSLISSESACMSSFGIGINEGIIEWDFTVNKQETGVRLGICYDNELNYDFATNYNIYLVGCGSGQRYLKGEWITHDIDSEKDSIKTGMSATFTLDMNTQSLYINVRGEGKRIVTVINDCEQRKLHPSAFLRTGERNVTFGRICRYCGYTDFIKEKIFQILKESSDLAHVKDCCNRLPLHRACENAAPVDILSALISAYPDGIKIFNSNQRLPLHFLMTNKNASLVALRLLIDTYLDAVSTPDLNGHLPLHIGVTHGVSPQIIQYLIQTNGDASGKVDKDKRLPLHLALVYCSSLDVIKMLLESTALEVADKVGNLPIHCCCLNLQSIEVLELLIKMNASLLKKKNSSGKTVLHVALDSNAPLPFIEILLTAWTDAIYEKDMLGRSPLNAACSSKFPSFECVSLILNSWTHAAKERDSHGRLPLHIAIASNAPISIIRLLITAFPQSLHDEAGDCNQLPIVTGIINNVSHDIISEVLPHYINILVSDKDESSKQLNNAKFSWTTLLRDGKDHYHSAVSIVLDKYVSSIQNLAFSLDEHGRRAVDIATPICKKQILKKLFLCGRYEIKSGSPLHQSTTSRVHYAIDHSSTTVEENQVVLKFMKNREQFLREISQRSTDDDDTIKKFVVPVMCYYDSDKDLEFYDQLQSTEYVTHPYLLVLSAGDRCLASIIDHERETADYMTDEVIRIAKQVASALDYLHSKGIIHGDLKPRNIVRVGTHYKLIDLDAAACIGERCGLKSSTAFSPPELLRTINAVDPKEAYCTADPSFDVWGYGVTLFQVITGQTLIHADSNDNGADNAQLKIIEHWTDDDRVMKLSRVHSLEARNLLSHLLQKDPKKRFKMSQILAHPFVSGKRASRLYGDKALYDVFISYRVATDKNIAELLYSILQENGISCFLDSQCLEPGCPWEEGFCKGLVHSNIFVPILSRNAINNSKNDKQNFSKLQSDSPCDNVLLEYRLALELHERDYIKFIYPLFIGDYDDNDGYSNYWSTGCHPSITSTQKVIEIEKKFREHLNNHCFGTPLLDDGHHSSTKCILDSVVKHQGYVFQGRHGTAVFNKISEDIKKMKSKII